MESKRHVNFPYLLILFNLLSAQSFAVFLQVLHLVVSLSLTRRNFNEISKGVGVVVIVFDNDRFFGGVEKDALVAFLNV